MTSLTVWFGQDEPPGHLTHVLLWESFRAADAPATVRSLPEEIHQNRDELRATHLRWIHQLGTQQVKGVPLRQRLCIRPQLSYWWMSLPSCNALEPDSPVYWAVRLRMLKKIAVETEAECIELANADGASARLIRSWGRGTGRRVTGASASGRPTNRQAGAWSVLAKNWLLQTFPPLGAINEFLSSGISEGARDKNAADSGASPVVMVDYMAHLRESKAANNAFASNYWGPLVDLVQSLGPTEWLHLSAHRPKRGLVEEDLATMRSWRTPPGVQHTMLQAGVTWRIRLRALRDYLRVAYLGLRTRSKRKLLWDEDSGASMWPVFRRRYRDDWYGVAAFQNCLALNLFEYFFSTLPKAQFGVYLFENQPWEMALIHAWQSQGHGELVGFAHSTITFWNTRYLKYHRDLWSDERSGTMPCPDQVAVNGPQAREMLLQGGYPAPRLVDVEAVRYVEGTSPALRARPLGNVLLVFGEYDASSTHRILEVVKSAIIRSGFDGQVTFRAHPAMTPHLKSLPDGFAPDGHLSSTEALHDANLVVCGALSSVAAEALHLRKPTYIIGDGRTFTSSPVDTDEQSWVFRTDDLATQLRKYRGGEHTSAQPTVGDYFWTKPDLAKWRHLLHRKPRSPSNPWD